MKFSSIVLLIAVIAVAVSGRAGNNGGRKYNNRGERYNEDDEMSPKDRREEAKDKMLKERL